MAKGDGTTKGRKVLRGDDQVEFRRKVYELAKLGNSLDDIGGVLGIHPDDASRKLRAAVVIDGLDPLDARAVAPTVADPTVTNPVEAAEVVATAALVTAGSEHDKFHGVREACRAAGMKPAFVNALIRRLGDKLSSVHQEARRISVREMTEEIERKLHMIFGYMDDVSMSQASLKDLAIATGILIEKRELLNNRPTQIIDFTSRMQVQHMLPRLVQEAKRRGITIEQVAGAVPVEVLPS